VKLQDVAFRVVTVAVAPPGVHPRAIVGIQPLEMDSRAPLGRGSFFRSVVVLHQPKPFGYNVDAFGTDHEMEQFVRRIGGGRGFFS